MYPGVEYLGLNGLEIELAFEAKEQACVLLIEDQSAQQSWTILQMNV